MPGPEAPTHDPLAVAVGNGSLLGVGYFMLGRRGTAAATGVITLGLVVVLAATRSGWMELVLVGWWAVLIVHGWLLARPGSRVRRQLWIAFSVAIPVLLVVGLLRWDAAGIDADLSEARDQGDCGAARKAVDRVWFGHRLADAPMTVRTDATAAACDRLETAESDLDNALLPDDGGSFSLAQGFHQLDRVLAEQPGHERMVDAVLDGFLGRLPVESGCDTASIADEIREQPARDNTLDRAAEVVPEVAPAALIECGVQRRKTQEFDDARARFRQLLDQYPRHELAPRATRGILDIQLAEIRILDSSYCDTPKPYGGAPPYRKGTNRALLHGNNYYKAKLPGAWRTTDVADATLIVCMDPVKHGPAVDSCPYERMSDDPLAPPVFPGGFDPGHQVTFHKITIGVRAYELRTGKRVVNTKVTIGGASCPRVLHYEYYGTFDTGPPGDVLVRPSAAEVRDAFTRVFIRK